MVGEACGEAERVQTKLKYSIFVQTFFYFSIILKFVAQRWVVARTFARNNFDLDIVIVIIWERVWCYECTACVIHSWNTQDIERIIYQYF